MTTRRTYLRALACAAALTALPLAGVAAASLEVTVTDAGGLALEHAVVSLHTDEPLHAPPGTRAVIDQRDRRFAPGVMAIQSGTDVAFPNSDDVRHHVYSFSPAKTFQIKLYHGEASAPVHFGEPGIVVLGCNIHDSMLGYLAVVDTPLFATSAPDGTATIAEAPPGIYTLQVWHPDLGMRPLRREITVGAEGSRVTVALDGPEPAAARPVARETSPLQSLFD